MRFSIFRRSPTRLLWSRPPAPSIADHLAKINSLPTISGSSIRSMALIESENFRFSDHLEALASDASMSVKLLEIASRLTSRRLPCRTPERALSVLGIEQASRVVSFLGLREALSTKEESQQEKIQAIWKRSISTAFLAKELNLEFRLGFQGIEFSAAMLHDVGRIVLQLVDPDKAKKTETIMPQRGDIFDHERKVIGTDHGEIGVEYALRQNLPVRVRRVIRFHHNSLSPMNDQRQLTDVVAAADELNPMSMTPEKCQWALQRMISREFSEFAEGLPERLARLTNKASVATREFFDLCEVRTVAISKASVRN